MAAASLTLGFSYACSAVDETILRPTGPTLLNALQKLGEDTAVVDMSPVLPAVVDRIMRKAYRTEVRGEGHSVWGRSALKATIFEGMLPRQVKMVKTDAILQFDGFFRASNKRYYPAWQQRQCRWEQGGARCRRWSVS